MNCRLHTRFPRCKWLLSIYTQISCIKSREIDNPSNSPRPSDAHVHITVRSNTSASSLPSLTAGPNSINTQGYVLTAPMSHQTASSRHSGSHSHHEHNDQDPITFYGVEDPWVRDMYTNGRGYRLAYCCCCLSPYLEDGCCFSNRHGCCFSERGGLCCSDRGGCCCSDHEGVCFSDYGGWFCSLHGGWFCSTKAGYCCSFAVSPAATPREERLPVMQSNARSA